MAYTTIKKPSDYFNTNLWTSSASELNVTGVGFQPDLVWMKSRSVATDHGLWDNVRGVQKLLISNGNDAESTTSGLTSFDSDGFTLGTANSNYNGASGRTMVGWNWLASNTIASNTDGSITSTVSANTTSGFSIVSYTGTGSAGTIGHGLGVTPDFIILKSRSGVHNWYVYHKSYGVGYAKLNLTDAFSSATDVFPVAPTSSVFSIATDASINTNTHNYIAYCFAEKQGFSKFGKYTGNGSTDGTFVYTGFKPAMVIIKLYDNAGTDWNLVDNKRAGYNPDNYFLAPNSSGAENTVDDIIDFTSNGFKLRSGSGASNYSGWNYIYMAFAEEPLVGDNPATAR